MPSALTYPGVYVEEVPSGVRTIVGVGTSIAAFVGLAKRGPVDEPVTINSFGDFQRIFGGVWEGSLLGHAVRDFYLNGGSQAIIVRVFKPQPAGDDVKTKAEVEAKAAVDELIAQLRAEEEKADFTFEKVRAVVDKFYPSQELAGADAAIAAIEMTKQKAGELASQKQNTPSTSDLVAAAEEAIPAVGGDITAPQVEAAKLVAKTVADVAKTEGKTVQDVIVASAQVAIEQSDADARAAKLVFDAVTEAATPQPMSPQLLITELEKQGAEIAKAVKDGSSSSPFASLTEGTTTFHATSEGDWGNKIRVRFESEVDDDDDEVEEFNIRIFDEDSKTTEFFRKVTIRGKRPLDQILRSESTLLRVASVGGNAKVKLSKKIPPREPDVWKYWSLLTGGSDSASLIDADFTKDENNKKGLFALENSDLFNILYIPPFEKKEGGAELEKKEGVVERKFGPGDDLLGDAAAYCARRRAMLLIDHPDGADKELNKAKIKKTKEDIAGALGDSKVNSAMFFPGLLKIDESGELKPYASCGAVAGVFARTDTKRGVWKAPAGFEASITGASGLRVQLTDAENGEFNPLGINCLRAMPGAGRVVWGARTLAGDDRNPNEWKYIPVRRTALYIEESLYRGTHWVVFEPNDEPLWAQIRLSVGAFMNDLFRQGAFQGRTPRDAYLVKCDQETNPQNDIDKGIVNIWVGFAPLKPAEFVVLKLRQIAGNIET